MDIGPSKSMRISDDTSSGTETDVDFGEFKDSGNSEYKPNSNDNDETKVQSKKGNSVAVSKKKTIRKKKRPKISRTEKNETFACNLCSSIYTSKFGLHKHHVKYHLNVNDVDGAVKPKFNCDSCTSTFMSAMTLRMHKAQSHPAPICNGVEYPYPCQLCSSAYKSKMGLKKHTLKYHRNMNGAVTPKYNCHNCSSTFMSVVMLRNHNAECHPGAICEGVRCAYCGELFATYRNLSDHLELHIGGVIFSHSNGTIAANSASTHMLSDVEESSDGALNGQVSKANTEAVSPIEQTNETLSETFGQLSCKVCNTMFECCDKLSVHLESHLNGTYEHDTDEPVSSNGKRKTANSGCSEWMEIVATTSGMSTNETENSITAKFDEKKKEAFVNEFVKTYCVDCYTKFQSDVEFRIHDCSELRCEECSYLYDPFRSHLDCPDVCDKCSCQFYSVDQKKDHLTTVADSCMRDERDEKMEITDLAGQQTEFVSSFLTLYCIECYTEFDSEQMFSDHKCRRERCLECWFELVPDEPHTTCPEVCDMCCRQVFNMQQKYEHELTCSRENTLSPNGSSESGSSESDLSESG